MTNVSAAVFPETATDYEFACLMKAGNVPRTAMREALANRTVTPDLHRRGAPERVGGAAFRPRWRVIPLTVRFGPAAASVLQLDRRQVFLLPCIHSPLQFIRLERLFS
jgi:hypothetical protein